VRNVADLATLKLKPERCNHYIPDEYEICDWCILEKYNLSPRQLCDMYEDYYAKEDVVEALRKAEKNEN